jgi:hypothetical protein
MRVRMIGMGCMGLAIVLGIAVMLGHAQENTLVRLDDGPVGLTALAPDSSSGVSDIETFLQCINEYLSGGDATVADTVQCIPPGCTVTLTMSDNSAQQACSLSSTGGVGTPPCQLPRVILTCPGPPTFMPSYLLCPEGSNNGSNRIEIGVVVGNKGEMQMADFPSPPGPYMPLGLADVLSVVPDSKECNSCHSNGNAGAAQGQPQLSLPIDPFGKFGNTALTPLIISTDEPGQLVNPGPGLTAQSLSEVCGCIENAQTRNDPTDPLNNEQGRVVLALCRALEAYQESRGYCTEVVSSPPSGPDCDVDALGYPCDPNTGGTAQASTGYTCQIVDEDLFQCVSVCFPSHVVVDL